MLDHLGGRQRERLDIETQCLDGGPCEQREAVAAAPAAVVPFSSRWTTMTSVPASSSRSEIRVRTYEPWWTKTFRSSRGASLHELQSQRRGLLDAPEPAAEGEVRGLDRIEQEGARPPSSTYRNAARPRTSQPERGMPPDDGLEQIAAIIGACSSSLCDR